MLQETRKSDEKFPIFIKYVEKIQHPIHWHGEFEIMMVLKGNCLITQNFEKRELSAGDIMFCPPGTIHSFSSLSSDNKSIFLLFDSLPDTSLSSLKLEDFFPFCISRNKDDLFYNLLVNNIEQISEEIQNKKIGYEYYIKSKIYEILFILIRNFMPNINSNSKVNLYSQKISSILKLISYVDQNFSENISLSHAAKLCNYSTAQFCIIFKHLSGLTFKNYLNQIRIQKASEIMSYSNKNLTTIAMDCGFSCYRTFLRSYKNIYGYAPTKT